LRNPPIPGTATGFVNRTGLRPIWVTLPIRQMIDGAGVIKHAPD
jgi:hypothetical protein